ncbi:hypothetical protein TSUD_33830 [Trifolium subterraneum]|uniref:Uncharacterized protein n=1 Tax=Trifolium subterraneum TaxID=3900 RepID=A0A2Z6LSW1_TRISU|nr:hypothetical protein TSUD_33830 [Trifolium subterraneum]
MTISTSIAQFVIDTNGESVEEGNKYFIRPAITGSGGNFSLVIRNGSCPLNVVLDNPELPHGLTVAFIPLVSHHDEHDVRLNKDLRIQFIASTICGQSTDWRLGERDATSGRRLIMITGKDDGKIGPLSFFRIVQTEVAGIYFIEWCPREVCSYCMLECGAFGIIRENGKTLLALDGGVIPVVFQKS